MSSIGIFILVLGIWFCLFLLLSLIIPIGWNSGESKSIWMNEFLPGK